MSYHIVHVEDEDTLLEALELVMKDHDPQITLKQFKMGDAALKYFEQYADHIDAVVLDIRIIGRLDGVDVAQEIRKRGWKRAIVITSAYGKPPQNRTTNLDVVWIAKPWRFDTLYADLAHIIRQYKEKKS